MYEFSKMNVSDMNAEILTLAPTHGMNTGLMQSYVHVITEHPRSHPPSQNKRFLVCDC